MTKPNHNVSHEILEAGLSMRDLVIWQDINDPVGAFFTGAVYVAEHHAKELQDRINKLEEALEDIMTDTGAVFAADPGRWPSNRAAEALAGRPLSQQEIRIFQQQISAKRMVQGEK